MWRYLVSNCTLVYSNTSLQSCFQQDSARCHISRVAMNFLKLVFPTWLIPPHPMTPPPPNRSVSFTQPSPKTCTCTLKPSNPIALDAIFHVLPWTSLMITTFALYLGQHYHQTKIPSNICGMSLEDASVDELIPLNLLISFKGHSQMNGTTFCFQVFMSLNIDMCTKFISVQL
jgi:hypothetical protein